MLLVIGTLLVAGGLFALVAGLVRTRMEVAASPTPIELALGEVAPAGDEPVSPLEAASVLYRVSEPLVVLAIDLGKRLAPRGRIELIGRRIVLAGLESRITAERILAYKVGAAVVGLLLGLVVHVGPVPAVVWSLFWGVVGFFVPDVVLGSRADSRQNQIGRDLPEALDLLAITVEAGLGLEQALQTVSDNLPGPLGDELTRLLREIELGVSRREALAALRERTAVPELSAFVVALMQADAMGVAISDVLKVQAAQVRLRRRQRAREQAAKTPVKILFPVIFGVLPALFVVIIGPAAISVLDNLIHH